MKILVKTVMIAIVCVSATFADAKAIMNMD
jgi:hypothetical protein